MWRGHLALVLCRRQDAGGTQGRDGLATIGMRLPPNRIDGKGVAASSLDHRPAGFKLGDGRECQRPAKHVLAFGRKSETSEMAALTACLKNTI